MRRLCCAFYANNSITDAPDMLWNSLVKIPQVGPLFSGGEEFPCSVEVQRSDALVFFFLLLLHCHSKNASTLLQTLMDAASRAQRKGGIVVLKQSVIGRSMIAHHCIWLPFWCGVRWFRSDTKQWCHHLCGQTMHGACLGPASAHNYIVLRISVWYAVFVWLLRFGDLIR